MLALSTYHQWYIHGIDIYGAFLTAELTGDDEVYVKLPSGIVPDVPDGRGGHSSPVWKLLKSLYGLRRAPRSFYDSLASFLISNGYTRSIMDPCLLYRIYNNGDAIIFSIHVDDFAITSNSMQRIHELCELLRQRYTITETEDLETFLGIRIESHEGLMYLSQPGHIQKMAITAGINPKESTGKGQLSHETRLL
jgi:hypothetical protein